MLILCIYKPHTLCVGPTYIFKAWEFCFFIIHFGKAFGDTSVSWT